MVMTKKLAEQLAEYLEEQQISVCYLHSELDTPQRTELLMKLRLGVFDCLVGVNLLREGIDLPEVALVAIMDADLESFLRDKRSLIQIMGRAARNTESRVLLYADNVTQSMQMAMQETARRRTLQERYNKEHGITPTTVQRTVVKSITPLQQAIQDASKNKKKKKDEPLTPKQRIARLVQIEAEMRDAAQRLDFERAIKLRAEWQALQQEQE
jgi:excinuclease ABC subunit B